jgi:hypothetical protein
LALWINQETQWFFGEPPETPRTRCRLRQSAPMRPALDPAGHRVP